MTTKTTKTLRRSRRKAQDKGERQIQLIERDEDKQRQQR